MPDRLRPIETYTPRAEVASNAEAIAGAGRGLALGIQAADDFTIEKQRDEVNKEIDAVTDNPGVTADVFLQDLHPDPEVAKLQTQIATYQASLAQGNSTAALQATLRVKQSLSNAIARNPRLADELIKVTNQTVSVSPKMEALQAAATTAGEAGYTAGERLDDIYEHARALGLPLTLDLTKPEDAAKYHAKATREFKVKETEQYLGALLADSEVDADRKAEAFVKEGLYGQKSPVQLAIESVNSELEPYINYRLGVAQGQSANASADSGWEVVKAEQINLLTDLKAQLIDSLNSTFAGRARRTAGFESASGAVTDINATIDMKIKALQDDDVTALQQLEIQDNLRVINLRNSNPSLQRYHDMIQSVGGGENWTAMFNTFGGERRMFQDRIATLGLTALEPILTDAEALAQSLAQGNPESPVTDPRRGLYDLRAKRAELDAQQNLEPDQNRQRQHELFVANAGALSSVSDKYADPSFAATHLNNVTAALDYFAQEDAVGRVEKDLLFATFSSDSFRDAIDNLAKTGKNTAEMVMAGQVAQDYLMQDMHRDINVRNQEIGAPLIMPVGVAGDNVYVPADYIRINKEQLEQGVFEYVIDYAKIEQEVSQDKYLKYHVIQGVERAVALATSEINRQVRTYVTVDKLRNPTRATYPSFIATLTQYGYGDFLTIGQ